MIVFLCWAGGPCNHLNTSWVLCLPTEVSKRSVSKLPSPKYSWTVCKYSFSISSALRTVDISIWGWRTFATGFRLLSFVGLLWVEGIYSWWELSSRKRVRMRYNKQFKTSINHRIDYLPLAVVLAVISKINFCSHDGSPQLIIRLFAKNWIIEKRK